MTPADWAFAKFIAVLMVPFFLLGVVLTMLVVEVLR